MEMSLDLWLEYLLRFSHLVAGIAWVGSSFYFIWLDSSFTAPSVPRRNVDGELFMVHGGFYYQVEKRKIYPGEMPQTLHWFKWEATLTWVTGFLLFIVLYFFRGASLLIDSSRSPWTPIQAIGLSLGAIVASWVIYDLIWKKVTFKWLASTLSLGFFAALIFLLTQTFSGRGAFILTGAIFGTLMLMNVWMRILPGQIKMLKAAQSGQIPDYSVSLKAKVRSVHNTYFIFPVLFIMLSNHYPLIYNHAFNWLLLMILAVSGALVRHAMVTNKAMERWTLAPAALGLLALVFITAVSPQVGGAGPQPVSFSQVQNVVQHRCLSCHSSFNTDESYHQAPRGLLFESESQIRAHGEKIYLHVVLARSMPLGNKTAMSEDERQVVGQWLKQEGLVQTP